MYIMAFPVMELQDQGCKNLSYFEKVEFWEEGTHCEKETHCKTAQIYKNIISKNVSRRSTSANVDHLEVCGDYGRQ